MADLAKREIDGEIYEFQKYGAKDATRTLIRLSKICGKALAKGVAAVEPGEEGQSLLERKLNPHALSDAVEALTNSMDEDTTMDLIEKLTSDRVLCNGKRIVFDKHYEDRLGHMFQVLYAALEVQYGNFINAISGPVSSATAAPAPSTSSISNHSPAT